MDFKPGDKLDNFEFRKGSDFLILIVLVPVMCFARMAMEKFGRSIFLSTDAAEVYRRSKKRTLGLTLRKFEESFWKCGYYSVSAILGILFFSWEPYMREPYAEYPNVISTKLHWFYMLQIAFYIWMSVSLLWDTRRKDFYQMTIHHGITLALMMGSYSYSMVNAGAVVLLTHDLADPFLELAKMCTYSKKEKPGTIFFIIFMFTFMFMRLVVYPRYAVYPCMFHTYNVSVALDLTTSYYVLNACMVTLLGLDIYWSILIAKVCVTQISGKQLKDNRSDVESD